MKAFAMYNSWNKKSIKNHIVPFEKLSDNKGWYNWAKCFKFYNILKKLGRKNEEVMKIKSNKIGIYNRNQ